MTIELPVCVKGYDIGECTVQTELLVDPTTKPYWNCGEGAETNECEYFIDGNGSCGFDKDGYAWCYDELPQPVVTSFPCGKDDELICQTKTLTKTPTTMPTTGDPSFVYTEFLTIFIAVIGGLLVGLFLYNSKRKKRCK
jgi:hypothetical protein